MDPQVQKKVVDIVMNESSYGDTQLNKIVFADGYIAHEKAPQDRMTNFKIGKTAMFRITHPAKASGKTDWILFVMNLQDDVIPGGTPTVAKTAIPETTKGVLMREYILVTQNALNNAVAAAPFLLGNAQKEEGGDLIDQSDKIELITDTAKEFSDFIIKNAERLLHESMQLPKDTKGEAGKTPEKKDTIQNS